MRLSVPAYLIPLYKASLCKSETAFVIQYRIGFFFRVLLYAPFYVLAMIVMLICWGATSGADSELYVSQRFHNSGWN